MKHKAEIFDQLQYLYKETGFNDHYLHCEISFHKAIELPRFKKAIWLLFQAIPILTYAYISNHGKSYWKKVSDINIKDILFVTKKENEYKYFLYSTLSEQEAPQMKICYLQSNEPKITFLMNHMVCDASGFKEVLYLLCACYNDFAFVQKNMCKIRMHGDRGLSKIIQSLSLKEKMKVLLFDNKENNAENQITFPLSYDEPVEPYIFRKTLSKEQSKAILAYAKNENVTVNDIILAAYYRVISDILDNRGEELVIPIMIDMRKYQVEQPEKSLANYASTVLTKLKVSRDETFWETVSKVNAQMEQKKNQYMGMNVFVKSALLFNILGQKCSYALLKKVLHNPKICMTNIGILDHKKLKLEGIDIFAAWMCGSIKYRPHIQLAVSTFGEQFTFTSNLYSSKKNANEINDMLTRMEKELLHLQDVCR